MKPSVWTILLALAAGSGSLAAAPVAGPPRPMTEPGQVTSPALPDAGPVPIEALFQSARTNSAVWSADGRAIIYGSSQSGRMNLWRQPIGGGRAEPISQSDNSQEVFGATADGQWIVFASDRGGREMNDLFALPVAGGEPVNLTNSPDTNETWARISRDGTFIAFSLRARHESSLNLAVMDLATRQMRRLTDEQVDGVQWAVVAMSRDGRFIFANRFDWSFSVGEAYRIDVATGEATRLTPEGVYASVGDVSPDGQQVSLTIEDGNGLNQAALLDLKTGRYRLIAPGAWEQKAGPFSPDGATLLIVSNVDGRESVLAYDLARGALRDLAFPAGINSTGGYIRKLPEFSDDGAWILFPHSSGSEPTDYWVYRMADGQLRRATRLAALDTARLPKTQLVRYASQDGTVISAYLWMPYNLRRDGRAPAVALAHGGPTGQQMDHFDAAAAALASRGYLVLAPNFRGSTGYGRAFLDANRMDLGGGDLEDVVAGARFLAETGYVDPGRIGITGGSYGGYMTYMALAKTPEVWAAGVAEFGIINWRTMWEHGAPQNRRYQKGLVGDPAENPDVYDRASPLTYLHQLKAPLLVLHGENDPRVPLIEARQVVEYLRQNGRVVDARFYPEEGHGFSRRENQIDALTRKIQWFETHLKAR